MVTGGFGQNLVVTRGIDQKDVVTPGLSPESCGDSRAITRKMW